jgi:hypothetical protein
VTTPLAPAFPADQPRRRWIRRGNLTIGRHTLPTCPETGKIRYRDRHQVSDGLRSAKWQRDLDLRTSGETNRRETRSYRCPSCDGWHTTSMASWVAPRTQAGPASA